MKLVLLTETDSFLNELNNSGGTGEEQSEYAFKVQATLQEQIANIANRTFKPQDRMTFADFKAQITAEAAKADVPVSYAEAEDEDPTASPRQSFAPTPTKGGRRLTRRKR